MLDKQVIVKIEQLLKSNNLDGSIKSVSAVSGGCINACYQIKTDHQFYFLKVNELNKFPEMFTIEANSLSIIKETNTLKTPNVIAQFDNRNQQYLVLEWIESRKTNAKFWQQFAVGLAKLHQHAAKQFGLPFDNYIGSLKQSNTHNDSWTNFYIEQRIQPQVKLAFDHQKISKHDVHQFDQCYNTLPEFFPDEPPALIHGDLWSGNFLCDENGEAVLIDPAIYYANREMELAFTKLFGGFDAAFYHTYHDIYPLAKDFERRIPVYNLYSLLVHLNLFGGHYYGQVMDIVKLF